MSKQQPRDLVIDARPRGPNGPLAVEPILGRPVLDHLLDLAGAVQGDAAAAVVVHARADEHGDAPAYGYAQAYAYGYAPAYGYGW